MSQETIIVKHDSKADKVSFIREAIESHANNLIFRAVNVKKDGSLREYRARVGVSKHVKGAGSTTKHKEELITIYDMGMAAKLGQSGISIAGAPYRSFNMETTLMLEFAKGDKQTTYIFIDEATQQAIADIKTQTIIKTGASVTSQVVSVLKSAL